MTKGKIEDIHFNKLDHQFKDEVAEKIGLETIKPCFTCGSCTGICPVHEVIEDFDPRIIIYKILLGRREEVLSSDLIWFCCLCNACFFVCPFCDYLVNTKLFRFECVSTFPSWWLSFHFFLLLCFVVLTKRV